MIGLLPGNYLKGACSRACRKGRQTQSGKRDFKVYFLSDIVELKPAVMAEVTGAELIAEALKTQVKNNNNNNVHLFKSQSMLSQLQPSAYMSKFKCCAVPF